ncbi:MAG: transporter [Flavobacterium sp.]|nr:MAG: transporter [Flavobacterium sp.]
MKKLFTLTFILSLSMGFASVKDSLPVRHFRYVAFPEMGDCDACGCSATGGSMGFSSVFNNNFVGLRYFYQSYTSKDGIFDNSPHVDENFNTIQAWARIPVSKKLQLSALIPYHFHTRERAEGDENISGLGDATLLAMYNLYQTKKDSVRFHHKLQFGGGVKLPTGKYDEANNAGSVNPGFQVGTGSLDYMVLAEYVLQSGKLGLSNMINYVFKTENRKEYRFGDQLNYGSTLFYLIETPGLKLVPQAGLAGEVYKENFQHGQSVADTGGNVLFGRFGFEAGRKDFSIGVNAMLPVTQNLSGGNVEANYRWSVNLNYSL